MKVCLICNKEFKPKRSTAMYCTPECKKQAAKIRDAKRRGAQIIKDCPVCGKWFEIGKDGAKTKYCSDECFREARRIENRDRWRRANPGWDDGIIKTCEHCGKKFKANTRHIQRTRYCSDNCRYQESYRLKANENGIRPLEEYKKEIVEKAEENKARKIKERQEKREKAKSEREERERRSKLIRDSLYIHRECAVCGKQFKTIRHDQISCSERCAKRWQRRKKDKRINDINCVDDDITLMALYDRDNGICHICGDPCDYEDCTREGNNVTVGITYPSIDHVIPLSKNGLHSWANVRLAHHYCNAIKNDAVDENEQTEKPIGRTSKRSWKPKGKAVKQLSIQGELIAEYESTVEAERKTGFKQRGIQAAARGEARTSHGYMWSY